MVPLPDGARLRRTWPQRLLIAFNIVVVMACFAAAAVLGYVQDKAGQIQRVALGSLLGPTVDQGGDIDDAPRNILLVGVDSAEGLDPDDPRMQGREGGTRSDTIMVLRVDPEAERAALLSFPRDLWVELGDTGQRARINAALPLGGPDLLIETIGDSFGIDINHYVQVDFAQFERLVDVVGGVDLPVGFPVRDRWTGLAIEEPGCVHLDGSTALDYVRSRHLEYFEDGRWNVDPYADLSRIRRQQDFIKRALDRAVERGIRNPFTLNGLIDAALDSVTVDDRLSVGEITALARRFGSFDPDSLELLTLPVVSDRTADGAQVLRLLSSQAQPIFGRFRGGSADSPEAVELTVLNGSGVPGEGRSAAQGFERAGFRVRRVGDALTTGYTTTIVQHRPGEEAAAELVARYLAADAELRAEPDLADAVVVVTGEDFSGVLADPRDEPAGEPSSAASSPADEDGLDADDEDDSDADGLASGDDDSGDDDSGGSSGIAGRQPASSTTTSSTTTTTVIGILPAEGQESLCR